MSMPPPLVDLPIPLGDGHWVNAKVARCVELIKEYDSKLDVVWIPPEKREPDEDAFIIVELTPKGPQPIFSVKSEEFMDERLLEQIYRYDAAKHNNVLSEMDARNKAKRDMIRKKHQEELMAAHDLAQHILKSPKIRYKHDGITYE